MKEYKEAAEFLCSQPVYDESSVVSYIADLMQPKLAMQQKILENAKSSEQAYAATCKLWSMSFKVLLVKCMRR